MLASQEVKKQAIIRAAINVMTLPLPANELKVQAFRDPEREILLDDPCIDRMKPELFKRKCEHL